MKRRLAQISLALVAVATLSACIIINSDAEPAFAPTSAPSGVDGAPR